MSRGSRLVALAATAALSVATAVLPSTAALATTSDALHQFRGAQLHLMWGENTATDITRQLDMLAATGADSGRLDVAWSSLQDSNASTFASWYVSKLDSVVSGAYARGIKLILTLQETPCWASSAPDTIKQSCAGAYWDRGVTHYAPSNPADYANAAKYIATRYASRIAALEVWNEPNWDDGTIAANLIAPDKAAAYVGMLKPAYTAVKSVAPSLPVLAAAMAFSDVPWLQSLWTKGARGYYDGISVHPYNEWRAIGAPHDLAYAKYDFVQGLNSVHTAMLNIGDNSPLWITEVGWSSCLSGGGTDRWCVTEQQQASYLPAVFTTVANWSWIHSVIVYNLRAKGSSLSDREACFGLVHKDYSLKPALAALTNTLTQLAASPLPTTSPSASPSPTTSPSPSPSPTTSASPTPTPTDTATATPTAAPKLKRSRLRGSLTSLAGTGSAIRQRKALAGLSLSSHPLLRHSQLALAAALLAAARLEQAAQVSGSVARLAAAEPTGDVDATVSSDRPRLMGSPRMHVVI